MVRNALSYKSSPACNGLIRHSAKDKNQFTLKFSVTLNTEYTSFGLICSKYTFGFSKLVELTQFGPVKQGGHFLQIGCFSVLVRVDYVDVWPYVVDVWPY